MPARYRVLLVMGCMAAGVAMVGCPPPGLAV